MMSARGFMARIEGITDKQADLFTRSIYAAVRRKIGRVPEPMRITAHQPRLLAALGGMEMAQEAVCNRRSRTEGAGRPSRRPC